MKKNKIVSLNYGLRLFLAVIISTIIFGIVLMTAYGVSYNNYQGVLTQSNLLEESLDKMDDIIKNQECDNKSLFIASEILDKIGPRIDLLEQRFGKNDPRVLERKKIYSDLEIKHLEIINYFNKNCDKDFITILFFYSNKRELIYESEKIGFILGKFKEDNSERVMVYSFDNNLDHITIHNLIKKYNVGEFPKIILDEKEITDISNIDDLNKHL